MSRVIQDDVLESLTCDICHKYLSVEPISTLENCKVKCGRCPKTKEETDSAFGKLFSNNLFKCINRFDGCKELLTFETAEEHEKNCVSETYECPICREQLPTFKILRHFKNEHISCVLDDNVFEMKLNADSISNSVFLYQVKDYLVIISCLLDMQVERKMELNATVLFNNVRYILGNQFFTINFKQYGKVQPNARCLYSIKSPKSKEVLYLDLPPYIRKLKSLCIEFNIYIPETEKLDFSITSFLECSATSSCRCYKCSAVSKTNEKIDNTRNIVYRNPLDPVDRLLAVIEKVENLYVYNGKSEITSV